MHKVTGLGGFFFRSRDPQALAAWYHTHLGIADMVSLGTEVWQQQAGPTVFAPFKADTAYFAADQPFMLNFRVSDLEGLLADLKAAGVKIDAERTQDDQGSFAWIYDPDGRKIELWQPPV